MQVYSMLAANLCMGWIDQLVQDSFAWRTHHTPFIVIDSAYLNRLFRFPPAPANLPT
jgi:hypothetical protein